MVLVMDMRAYYDDCSFITKQVEIIADKRKKVYEMLQETRKKKRATKGILKSKICEMYMCL